MQHYYVSSANLTKFTKVYFTFLRRKLSESKQFVRANKYKIGIYVHINISQR